MNRYLRIVLALCAIAIAVAEREQISNFIKRLAALRSHTEAVPVVKVAQVKKLSIPQEVSARGEVQPLKEEQVLAPVSGYIERVRFNKGDTVKAGQIVATFNVKDARQRLQQVEAAMQELQKKLRDKNAQLADAEKRLETIRDLYAKDLIAKKDVAAAESQSEAARAEKELAQTQLEQQEAALAQLRFVLKTPQAVAPMTGVVTDIFAEPNGYVQSSWPILTIAATDPLKAVVTLSEEQAKIVHKGMKATVVPESAPGGAINGEVLALDYSTATGERVAVVAIRIANREARFSLGSAVSVRIRGEGSRDAFFVPNNALLEAEGKPIVYVVEGERAIAVAVDLRPGEGGMTEITEGLQDKQWVIVDPPAGISPNGRVRVESENS